jgi:uncharacterized protein (TIGR02147 family)
MQNPVEFLNDEFRKRKERNPNYSLRAFAKWLQVSPAQLSQMLTAKRPITFKTLKKISDRLDISPSSSQDLMRTLMKEQNFIQESESKSFQTLKEDQFRLVSDWYHLAILSLTKVRGSKPDSRWIARRLGIQAEEANQALQRLVRLGLLQLTPSFKQIGEPFEVASEIPSAAIRKYHKQNLSLAIEKIETVDVSLRQFQSISLPTKPTVVKTLKKEIDQFLERASELSESKSATEVYHLNVQFFPVTQLADSPSKE